MADMLKMLGLIVLVVAGTFALMGIAAMAERNRCCRL